MEQTVLSVMYLFPLMTLANSAFKPSKLCSYRYIATYLYVIEQLATKPIIAIYKWLAIAIYSYTFIVSIYTVLLLHNDIADVYHCSTAQFLIIGLT